MLLGTRADGGGRNGGQAPNGARNASPGADFIRIERSDREEFAWKGSNVLKFVTTDAKSP
jgi:hypothetical protein